MGRTRTGLRRRFADAKVEVLSLLGAVGGIFAKHVLARWRRVESSRNPALADPFKVIRVDPEQIEYAAGSFTNLPYRYGGRFSLAYYGGAEVRGGDWDLHRSPVDQMEKYRAVEQRIRGSEWEETGIYDYLRDRIEDRGRYDGCSSEAELRERYRSIDDLIASIRSDGFKTDDGLDHVTVNIGRDGEILFGGNGKHRLSIAKVLGLEEIPVRVLVRHSEWQRFRDRVASAHRVDQFETDEQSLLSHPDLQDLTDGLVRSA